MAYPKITPVLEDVVVFADTYSIDIVDDSKRMEVQDATLEQRMLLGALSNDWSLVLTDIYSKFEAQDNDMAEIRADIAKLRAHDAELAAEIVGLRADDAELAAEIAKLRADDAELRADFTKLFAKLEALESQYSTKFKALDSRI
jgi:chromosome segregation ATPase